MLWFKLTTYRNHKQVIASGVTKTLAEVENYLRCTFLNECGQKQRATEDPQPNEDLTLSAAGACIEFLVKNDFIKVGPPCITESMESIRENNDLPPHIDALIVLIGFCRRERNQGGIPHEIG